MKFNQALALAGTVAALVATAMTGAACGSAAAGETRCEGINTCKGTSECKSSNGTNDCKGLNECAKQGWIYADDEAACTEAGGTVL
jgi:hypothetical protein